MPEIRLDDVELLVVGSAHLDQTLVVEALPAPGETCLAESLERRPGGKGANQAAAAARLGASTAFCGAVGDDPAGADIRAALEVAGVDIAPLRTLPGTSGTAVVLVEPGGENLICVAPGASGQIEWHTEAERWLAAHAGAALLLQQEVPAATNLAAARAARELGRPVLYNAAPAPRLDQRQLDLLGTVDVLLVNEHEARTLAGATSTTDLVGIAQDLTTLGPSLVVVTQGGSGALAVSQDWVVRRMAYAVPVLDTVGAGDAFCAQFALAHTAGLPIDTTLSLACAAGAVATRRTGAMSAMPTLDEVLALVSTG